MDQWNTGGFDHARAHAQHHHIKRELEQDDQYRNMHHNFADQGANDDQKRSWFLVRVWSRLFG